MTLISNDRVSQRVPILDVLTMCAKDQVTVLLLSVFIPAASGPPSAADWATAPAAGLTWSAIDSFKVMQRHQNSHAIVNAGFNLAVTQSSASAVPEVSAAIAVFGGVGKKLFRATQMEAALTGQALNTQTLQAALAALTKDIDAVGDSTAYGPSPAYRRRTSAALFYKFALRAQPAGSLPAMNQSGAERYCRPVSAGTQSFEAASDENPVGTPVIKLGAPMQTSGEAVYTYDLPIPYGGLHGAFAYTKVATGTVDEIDISEAEAMPGVVKVLTIKDIVGINDCGLMPGTEKLFLGAGDTVGCIGTRLALVVADTLVHAQAAAEVVYATYTPGATPLVSVAEARAAKSFFPGTPSNPLMSNLTRGDPSGVLKTCKHTLTGTVVTGGQRHFYMEVQNASASVVERKRITVTASTQSIDQTQVVVCNVTGLPAKNIDVRMRRAGGAFGGKISRGLHVAAGAGLASYILDRDVHVKLDRKYDLETVAGREPLNADYTVGFDDDGIIQVVETSMYSSAGYIIDTSFGDMSMAQLWASNCYYVANWRYG